MKSNIIACCLLLLAGGAFAKEPPAKQDKRMSGMSVVGNDDAPKSLVIVPWKSAEMGGVLDVSRALDDGRGPVDKDVFARELEYFSIRAAASGAKSSSAK
jgi:hypothetical protein